MISAILLCALVAEGAVQVAPEAIRESANQPQLAIAADGRLGLVYGTRSSLWVAVSHDERIALVKPTEIPLSGRIALGMRRGPRIAFSKKSVVVSAIVDGDLFAWTSNDGAMTWSKPIKINDAEDSAREGLFAMAARSDGSILAAWLDLRTKSTVLFASVSKNSAASWSRNSVVYISPDGSICECCHPSIGFGPFGEVGVMFRNSIRGQRDMYLAMSPDGGKSFAQAVKLGSGSWTIAACPMDGGALAFDETGNPVSVWRREEDIFVSRGSFESNIARGRNPWVAQMPRDHALVWESSNGNGVYFQQGSAIGTRTRLSEEGNDPVVVATRGHIVCAWRARGTNAGIFVQTFERR